MKRKGRRGNGEGTIFEDKKNKRECKEMLEEILQLPINDNKLNEDFPFHQIQ